MIRYLDSYDPDAQPQKIIYRRHPPWLVRHLFDWEFGYYYKPNLESYTRFDASRLTTH